MSTSSHAKQNPQFATPTNGGVRRPWYRRVLRIVGALSLFYVLTVLIGLIPVNNSYRAPTENAIKIYVSSNAVHADIIVPVANDVMDWREQFPDADFHDKVDRYTHVAIGWGDRGFFLKTPEWKDLRVSTAANAMFWPSDTVMHVQFTRPRTNEMCREVTINQQAYENLVQYILESFEKSPDVRKRIEYSYNRTDAFYEARGQYHIFNTCNCWVGRGLKRCGVRTPCFSPLPKTVLWYLPKSK